MWLWSSSRRATTWITPSSSSRWTRPCTAISRAPITILRCLSNTSGQITRLATPVSSSMVMNTTPLALPGRWRISTRPAIDRRLPSRTDLTCSAVTNFCARIMFAQEVHRMRFQAQADGLVVVHDMLASGIAGSCAGSISEPFVARLGMREQAAGRAPG